MVCFSNQTNRILLLQMIQQLITIRLTLALLEITLEKVLQIKDSFLLVGFRHNKRETCACIFESTRRCLQNLHAKMPPHMLLLEAEAVWTQYLPCKLNYMQFQHLLRVSCLHFSCVTVHFALREHETYCSSEHIALFQPPIHPPVRPVRGFYCKTLSHTNLTILNFYLPWENYS